MKPTVIIDWVNTALSFAIDLKRRIANSCALRYDATEAADRRPAQETANLGARVLARLACTTGFSAIRDKNNARSRSDRYLTASASIAFVGLAQRRFRRTERRVRDAAAVPVLERSFAPREVVATTGWPRQQAHEPQRNRGCIPIKADAFLRGRRRGG